MESRLSLKWMSGILIFLLVIYSLALFVVFLMSLILGIFLRSLIFEDTLSTQGSFILVICFFVYLIMGIITLISAISLGLLRLNIRKQVDPEWKGPKPDPIITIGGSLLFITWGLTSILSSESGEEFIFISIFGPIILGAIFLNWQVVDIPAKALALLGKEKVRRISRNASIPMMIALLGLIPITYSMGFEDAPITTIVIVYLEILFVLGIVTTLVSICFLLYHLKRQIKEMEGIVDLDLMGLDHEEDTKLFPVEK